jgi:hypothetical protein
MRILKIESLPTAKVWIDRDEIMLHACFQILKDFMEKENLLPIDSEEIKDADDENFAEVKFLYQWWNNRINNDDNYTIEQSKEDSEMLIRLMKIRTYLWT